jgi:phosphoglycerol geranylgeranyltransferase
MNTFERLIQVKRTHSAGYLLLVDPDKIDSKKFPDFINKAAEAGVDAFLVGGSLMLSDEFDRTLKVIKENTKVPVIIFPGSVSQVSPNADAILFLLLISGRNPDHLIGNQVIAAPIIKKMGLEAISTGYMLIEGGIITSAEFMSNTKPIPRQKSDIAVAHALAAELIGMKMLYLEAGSGAKEAVPDEMIQKVTQYCSLPVITGGGICTPEKAMKKVAAGASFIVTGTIIEQNLDISLVKEFAEAIHTSKHITV